MDPVSTDQSQNQADETQQPVTPASDPVVSDPDQPITPPQEPIVDDASAGLPVPQPGETTVPDAPVTGGLPGVENAPVVEAPTDQPSPEVAPDTTPTPDVTGDNPGDAPAPDQNQQLGSF